MSKDREGQFFLDTDSIDGWKRDNKKLQKLKTEFKELFVEEILPRLPEDIKNELAIESISYNKKYPAFHILKDSAWLLGDETYKNLHFTLVFVGEKVRVSISFYSNKLVEKLDSADKDEIYDILSGYHLEFRWGVRPAAHHFKKIGREWTDKISKEKFRNVIEKLVSMREKARDLNKNHPACFIQKPFNGKIRKNKDLFCEKIAEGLELLNPIYDYMNESLCSGEVRSLKSRLEKKGGLLESREEEKEHKEDQIQRLKQLGNISDRLEGLDEERRRKKLHKLKEEVSNINEKINLLEDEIEGIKSRLES